MILIYTTHPNIKTVKKIADVLLKKRLLGCVNFFPITSAYWWKSKIENTKEVVAIFKTTEKHWVKIQTEIKKLHPYTVPCIIKIKAQANKEFEKWLKQETL